MMKSIETVAQISAIDTAANATGSLIKNDIAVANTTRKSTQDAGRVHVGGGMMRF